MKKIFKSLLVVAIPLFTFIGYANAATIEVGNDKAVANSSGSVALELKDSDLKDYKKIDFELSINTSYADIKFSYEGSMEFKKNGDTITVSKDDGLSEGKLGTISYTTTSDLKDDFNITPVNVKFYPIDETKEVSNGTVVAGKITYQAPKSTDATLKNILVSQGELSPTFKSDTYEYSVTVSDTINGIRITPETTDSKANVDGDKGYKTLNLGDNKLTLEVTAEDGTTKQTYTINVLRGKEEKPSAYLTSLTLNNIGLVLSPEFDQKNNKYTVDITKDITKLDIKYEAEDKNATVEIDGNEDFVEGENKITITVTSSDKSSKEIYEIVANLTEEEEKKEETPVVAPKKKNNTWIIILIVVVILLIAGGVAFLLFRKKKSPKKADKKVETPKENIDTFKIEDESESVTGMLKKELYSDDDPTTTFDSREFNDALRRDNEMDKTKEFNFRDLK